MSDLTKYVPLITVRDLSVEYPIYSGFFRKKVGQMVALDSIFFCLERGKTVGLVGESGSGKSTLARTLVRLLNPSRGEIFYQNQPIGTIPEKEFRPYRKRIQMVFQDPFGSLNPRMDIYHILAEPLEVHFPLLSAKQKEARIAELLEKVGLQPAHMQRYPHEFSGGQRQRIGIARALATEPECLICDEPVSALDVSIQAQIINLLLELQTKLNLTYLFIAHDIALVHHVSDYLLVMQKGRIVERGSPEVVCRAPQHPYTQQLLSAVPIYQKA